ncbi:MAG: hypothetical protein PHT19_11500 [Methylococcus sp.]|nr:hypothetical protein [Methylococcus sp.]
MTALEIVWAGAESHKPRAYLINSQTVHNTLLGPALPSCRAAAVSGEHPGAWAAHTNRQRYHV